MRFILLILSIALASCSGPGSSQEYLFFLHNKYLELEGEKGFHHEYGRVEYDAIINTFRNDGFTIISEIRPRDTDARAYAKKVVHEIDSLIDDGVDPSKITVVGTSKGGYIAMYASSFLKNKDVNFVFVGCCDTVEMPQIPDFDFYGNILSIYEASDSFATSCVKIMDKFKSNMPRYEEVQLNTGLKHGFLYKALPDWMEPAMAWARKREIKTPVLTTLIDSVLKGKTGELPFNGIVLISQNNRRIYGKALGYADIATQQSLNLTDQVVIGSLSKQISSVLALREYEKGTLRLDDPVGKYVTTLKQPWKDSVTIGHLMSHTHGIKDTSAPLVWPAGSKMEYGNIGFILLGKVLEKVSGKTIAQLSTELFALAGMRHSTCPGEEKDSHRATGHSQNSDGSIVATGGSSTPYPAHFVPAGGFVSTAIDLTAWNHALHHGKLLADSTYKLMTTLKPNAVRTHPTLETMDYGYGIQMKRGMIGHSGYAPGYVSLNFYFPASRTSVVVLNNLAASEISKAYDYHVRVLKAVEGYLK